MDALERNVPQAVWSRLGEPDVSVEFAGGQLAAHRSVLVSENGMFSLVLSGEKTLRIPDMSGDVVLQLLLYVYTHCEPPQLRSVAADLLVLAHRLQISILKTMCEFQLMSDLSVENTVPYYVLAVQCSCDALRRAAALYFARHPLRVLGSQGWAQELRRDPAPLVELSRTVAGHMAVDASLEELNRLMANGINLNEEKLSV